MSGGGNVKRTFNDEKFRIFDDQDKTKRLEFEVSAISTGTTRTITVPDADITLSQGNEITSISSEYTITSTDYFINCTANTFDINLPTAVGASGKMYQIKNSGTGIITVNADGSETIDGNSTQDLFKDESITIISDNANWYII